MLVYQCIARTCTSWSNTITPNIYINNKLLKFLSLLHRFTFSLLCRQYRATYFYSGFYYKLFVCFIFNIKLYSIDCLKIVCTIFSHINNFLILIVHRNVTFRIAFRIGQGFLFNNFGPTSGKTRCKHFWQKDNFSRHFFPTFFVRLT